MLDRYGKTDTFSGGFNPSKKGLDDVETVSEAWVQKCEKWADALSRGEVGADWELVALELATHAGELVACLKNPRPAGLVVTEEDEKRNLRNCVDRVREDVEKVWRLSEAAS